MMNLDSFLQTAEAIKSYPLSPIEYISENPTTDSTNNKSHSICGFLSKSRLLWRANLGTIEIFDTQSNCIIAAWTFGAILHNAHAKVTTVCGIGPGVSTHVAVGVDLGKDISPRGVVGIICLHSSRLVRAFQLPQKVSTLCMVTGGDRIVDSCTLSNELKCCNGLLAVATANAGIFLIDICLDYGADKVTSDEICPATYADILVPDKNPEWRRSKAVANKFHPILCLSDNMNSESGPFQLLGPNQNVLFEAPANSVEVTAMVYIPQLSSLIIGYSFGSFQIINLSSITIDCASPYEEDFPPVVGLTYQEPENDPRNFVYLWVARSWNTGYSINDEQPPDSCGFYLYAMNYEKKEWIEEHGLWYQSLLSMSLRFDFEAAGGLGTGIPSSYPPTIFTSLTVDNATSMVEFGAPGSSFPTADEESGPVPEMSLSFFCWKGSYLQHSKLTTQHYVAVFDINQWYQAQMPSQLSLSKKGLCPYMAFSMLDNLPAGNDDHIAATPINGSWTRYFSRNSNGNDWYPSSLSFDFQFLTSQNIITYRCLSIQQKVLALLVEQGPAAIVNPEYAHACCQYGGLLLQTDVRVSASKLQVVAQREELLNVALGHQLMSFLNQCVLEFSLGKFTQLGCSLSLILQWAWDKVYQIKSQADILCSRFTPSAIPLNVRTLTTLHQLLTSLNHLSSLIVAIRGAAGEATNINVTELDVRVEVVELLHLSLKASLWFHQCGLLPENIDSEHSFSDDGHLSFPIHTLEKIYAKRHVELNKLNASIKSTDLLLIEVICDECGMILTEIWDRDDSVGVYPPPSLQSLLSVYLLPSVPVHVKHRIIQYLFLDLTSLLSESYSNMVEELVKYPSSFSLSPSIIKLTQAFWLIDHKDFEEGLSVLLHPLVNPDDITPIQHRAIIKAFLYQGEENCAVSYCKIMNPPNVDVEDIQLNLTLLLACGKIREAFHYQRSHRIEANAEQLLHHMFSGCIELGQLKSVLRLPLSPYEEEYFVKFLRSCKTSLTEDVLLAHFIQNSKFGDVYYMHQNASLFEDQSSQRTRNALMQGYLTHLPKYRQPQAQKTTKGLRTETTKLQPMSASIRQLKNSPAPKTLGFSYKSSLMYSCPPITPFRSKTQRRDEWRKKIGGGEDSFEEKDGTQIIFPTIQRTPKAGDAEKSNIFFGSPYRRDERLMSPADNTKGAVYKILEQVLKKSIMDVTPEKSFSYSKRERDSSIGADFVSMLRTPTSKKLNKRTSEAFNETPQSILKIRKVIQGTPSPTNIDSMPFAPSVLRKLQRLSPDKEETNSCSDHSDTPKQLRFHLPYQQKSPDVNSKLDDTNHSYVTTPLVRKSLPGFEEKLPELRIASSLSKSKNVVPGPEKLDAPAKMDNFSRDTPQRSDSPTDTRKNVSGDCKLSYLMDNDLSSSLILENVSANSSGLLDDETFHSLTEEMETDKSAVADELGHYADNEAMESAEADDVCESPTKNIYINMEVTTCLNTPGAASATILQKDMDTCSMDETIYQQKSPEAEPAAGSVVNIQEETGSRKTAAISMATNSACRQEAEPISITEIISMDTNSACRQEADPISIPEIISRDAISDCRQDAQPISISEILGEPPTEDVPATPSSSIKPMKETTTKRSYVDSPMRRSARTKFTKKYLSEDSKTVLQKEIDTCPMEETICQQKSPVAAPAASSVVNIQEETGLCSRKTAAISIDTNSASRQEVEPISIPEIISMDANIACRQEADPISIPEIISRYTNSACRKEAEPIPISEVLVEPPTEVVPATASSSLKTMKDTTTKHSSVYSPIRRSSSTTFTKKYLGEDSKAVLQKEINTCPIEETIEQQKSPKTEPATGSVAILPEETGFYFGKSAATSMDTKSGCRQEAEPISIPEIISMDTNSDCREEAEPISIPEIISMDTNSDCREEAEPISISEVLVEPPTEDIPATPSRTNTMKETPTKRNYIDSPVRRSARTKFTKKYIGEGKTTAQKEMDTCSMEETIYQQKSPVAESAASSVVNLQEETNLYSRKTAAISMDTDSGCRQEAEHISISEILVEQLTEDVPATLSKMVITMKETPTKSSYVDSPLRRSTRTKFTKKYLGESSTTIQKEMDSCSMEETVYQQKSSSSEPAASSVANLQEETILYSRKTADMSMDTNSNCRQETDPISIPEIIYTDSNNDCRQEAEPISNPQILVEPPTEDIHDTPSRRVKATKETPTKRSYVDSPMRRSARSKFTKKYLGSIQEESNSPVSVKQAEEPVCSSASTVITKCPMRKSIVPRLDLPLKTIIEDAELKASPLVVETKPSLVDENISPGNRRSPRSHRSCSPEPIKDIDRSPNDYGTSDRFTCRSSRETPERTRQSSIALETPERTTLRSSRARETPERTTRRSSITRETPERTTRPISIDRETPDRTTRRSSITRETPERTTRRSTIARETPERVTRSSKVLETHDRDIRGGSLSRETPDRTTRRSSIAHETPERVTRSSKVLETHDRDIRVGSMARETPGRTTRRSSIARETPERVNRSSIAIESHDKAIRGVSMSRETPERTTRESSIARHTPERITCSSTDLETPGRSTRRSSILRDVAPKPSETLNPKEAHEAITTRTSSVLLKKLQYTEEATEAVSAIKYNKLTSANGDEPHVATTRKRKSSVKKPVQNMDLIIKDSEFSCDINARRKSSRNLSTFFSSSVIEVGQQESTLIHSFGKENDSVFESSQLKDDAIKYDLIPVTTTAQDIRLCMPARGKKRKQRKFSDLQLKIDPCKEDLFSEEEQQHRGKRRRTAKQSHEKFVFRDPESAIELDPFKQCADSTSVFVFSPPIEEHKRPQRTRKSTKK